MVISSFRNGFIAWLLVCTCYACQGQSESGTTQYIDPFFEIEGQLCQHVRVIYEDTQCNLWFGTNVYGLMRYDGDSLVYLNRNHGVGEGRINSIAEDKDGNLWFGTYSGLTKYDGRTFENYPLLPGEFDNDIWAIHIDQSGLIWVGTMEGVAQFDGATFRPFQLPDVEVAEPTPRFTVDRVICIMEDRAGRIWFGTDGEGIHIYDPDAEEHLRFSHLSKEDGLCDNNIMSLKQTSNGNIWIATMYGGVSRYDGNTFTNFTREGIIDGIEAYGFFEDHSGGVWFSIENEGVFHFDGSDFRKYSLGEGLLSNGILSIMKDSNGRFWFGGWLGLFRFDGERFSSVTRDGPWD